MKVNFYKLQYFLIPFFLFFIVFYNFYSLYPSLQDVTQKLETFNHENFENHVENLSKNPHFIGSQQHASVRNYIVNQLEDMGLEVHTQTGTSFSNEAVVSIPQNIIARIPGANSNNKSLLLLSHYDSAVHSSYGAADAGSGVAAILESTRAFLETEIEHENDIIICITDGEEIGLNGAYLFNREHPWAKNVGLVLNFEARGASGPSNMLLETSTGNEQLITSFQEAKVPHPVANSLMYSVYKLLPNDTDSTVFREELDIPSLFFAFIDDHFVYHTSLDTPENLYHKSLTHQANYLSHLLPYYANFDLSKLESSQDYVYFDFPILGLVAYPFFWIPFTLVISFVTFFFLLFFSKKLVKDFYLKNAVYALIFQMFSLIIVGLLGYFLWEVMLRFYPHYKLILQGFPYNGHYYIFMVSTLGIIYSVFLARMLSKKFGIIATSLASVLLWLVVCVLLSIYLEGASFFVIPVFFSQLILFVEIINFKYKTLFQLILSIPILVILTPFVQFVPVGLGMNMLFASLILIVLISFLIIPLIYQLKQIRLMYSILTVLALISFFGAHFESSFDNQRPRPSSLVYLQIEGESYFATYESQLSPWNESILNSFELADDFSSLNLPSKYGTSFQKVYKAPSVEIPTSSVEVEEIENKVYIKLSPNQDVQRIDMFLEEPYEFVSIYANGKEFKGNLDRKQFLLSYYVVNNEALELVFELNNEKPLPKIQLYETSYTLFTNDTLGIPKRPKDELAMPFVTNDAIISRQIIKL